MRRSRQQRVRTRRKTTRSCRKKVGATSKRKTKAGGTKLKKSKVGRVILPKASEFVLDKEHARPKLTQPVTGLLVIYVDWCGPSRALLPEMDIAAKHLPKDRKIMAVNAENPDTRHIVDSFEEGINAFPTIKVVKHGYVTVNDYPGPPKAASMVEFLHSPLLWLKN